MRLLVQGLGPAFFVSLPEGTSARYLRASLHDVCGIPARELRLRSSGQELLDDSLLDGNFVTASLRLEGGKGGFGSLLRSGQPGVRVRKVGNDACRDLETGKRMRSVTNEQRLAQWQTMEKDREALLEQEKERIRKEKEDAKPKFDDVKYSTELTEIRESVVAAVQEGVKAAMQKQKEEAERKLKTEQSAAALHPLSKRHGLWTEYDDLPLSDEDTAPASKSATPAAAAEKPNKKKTTTKKSKKNTDEAGGAKDTSTSAKKAEEPSGFLKRKSAATTPKAD